MSIMSVLCLSGCTVRKIDMNDRHKKAYEIVPPEKLPEMCKKQVEMCKKNPFTYVYEENNRMYLVRGYGEKETGGYRVKIVEVAESSNTVFLKTELCGPKQKMPKKNTYPYCVVKVRADGKMAVFE